MGNNNSFTALNIKVTKWNFIDANRGAVNSCAVAEAVKDQVKWTNYVSVNKAHIQINDPEARIRYIWATPPALWKIIKDWDDNGTIHEETMMISLNRRKARLEPLESKEEIQALRKVRREQAKRQAAIKAVLTPEELEKRRVAQRAKAAKRRTASASR